MRVRSGGRGGTPRIASTPDIWYMFAYFLFAIATAYGAWHRGGGRGQRDCGLMGNGQWQ
jgi:hypothetical protein